MERNVKTISIGAIFLLILILLVVFLLWLGRFSLSERYNELVIYSTSEVALSANTPIKYKGIAVGRVKKVEFADISKGLIAVWLEIDPRLELRADAFLTLKSSGLAGANFLALDSGSSEQFLEGKEIAYHAGGMDAMLASAKNISESLDVLLSRENVGRLTATIAQLQSGTEQLGALMEASTRAMSAFDARLKSGEYDVKSALTPTLSELSAALESAQEFFRRANDFLDKVDENPYDSLFGGAK